MGRQHRLANMKKPPMMPIQRKIMLIPMTCLSRKISINWGLHVSVVAGFEC